MKKENKFLKEDMVEALMSAGFEPADRAAVTYPDVFEWLREEKNCHVNIMAGLERDGSVKYFLKSMIIRRTEITYKKRKYDEWEDCAEYALLMIVM